MREIKKAMAVGVAFLMVGQVRVWISGGIVSVVLSVSAWKKCKGHVSDPGAITVLSAKDRVTGKTTWRSERSKKEEISHGFYKSMLEHCLMKFAVLEPPKWVAQYDVWGQVVRKMEDKYGDGRVPYQAAVAYHKNKCRKLGLNPKVAGMEDENGWKGIRPENTISKVA